MRRRLLQAEVDFLSRYFGNTLDTDSIRLAATRGRRAYSIRSAHIRLPRHCFVNLETAAPVNLLRGRMAPRGARPSTGPEEIA